VLIVVVHDFETTGLSPDNGDRAIDPGLGCGYYSLPRASLDAR